MKPEKPCRARNKVGCDMVETVMTAIYPDAKDLCPCVGTLSLRVVIRMWGALPDVADNVERRMVASALTNILGRYPEGGYRFLAEVREQSNEAVARNENVDVWAYVTTLAQRS